MSLAAGRRAADRPAGGRAGSCGQGGAAELRMARPKQRSLCGRRRQHAGPAPLAPHVMFASSGASPPCALTSPQKAPLSWHCQLLRSGRGGARDTCSQWRRQLATACQEDKICRMRTGSVPKRSQGDDGVVGGAAAHARPAAHGHTAAFPRLVPAADVVGCGKGRPVGDGVALRQQRSGCRGATRGGKG